MSLKKIFTLCVILALVLIVVLGWSPLSAATRKIVNQLRLANGMNDGLVGYWSFDGADTSWATGIVTDASGQGNNGVVSGMATTTAPAIGIAGQALNFDGSNDSVKNSSPVGMDFSNTGQSFAVSVWVNFSALDGTYDGMISSKNTGDDSWSFYRNIGQLNASFMYAGTDAVSFPVVGVNQWHNYAVAYNGTTFQIYFDGSAYGSPFTRTSTIVNNNKICFGLYRCGSEAHYFSGRIDEARIYNRALSAAEIAYLYNKNKPASAGTVSSANKNGLIAYWNFDSSASTTPGITDMSGNGNYGMGYNGTTLTDLSTASSTAFSGKKDEGGLFDGSDDFVTGRGSGLPNAGANANITISAWTKPTTATIGGGLRNIFNKGQNGNCFNYGMVLQSGVLNARNSNGDFSLVGSVVAGKWQHVAVVFNGSSGATGYIDGLPVGSNASGGTTTCSITDWTIGMRASTGSSEWFNGSIDEVKIYNRALSAAEILAEYKSSSRAIINVSQDNFMKEGLVGYWPFDGKYMNWANSSAEATDASPSANAGNVTNFGQEAAVSGVAGQALKFDNTNDAITMGATGLTGDITATWSAWIKAKSVAYVGYDSPIAKIGSTVALGNFSLFLNSTGSGVLSLAYGGGNECATAAGTIAANTWYHVVGTKTAGAINTTSKLYVNGVEVACTGSASTPNVTAGGTEVGSWSDASYFFDGLIDEVRIYNRALTAGEVLQLYNATKH